jgi:hypothetical protein
MTTPRRRLIRPSAPSNGQPQTALQLQKLRAKLDKDRRDLARWMARLKRALTFVQKHQLRITRLERQITKLQGA